MPQPASAKTYPFETGSGQEAGNAEWRRLGSAFGDGIVNDVAGDAFHCVASGSDRTITVNLNELRERGIHYQGVDPTKTVALSTPTAGYTRADRIVAHYDPSDKSIDIVVHEGAEVNTGSPSPPALHRNSGGTWDLTLWRFTGGTGAASTLTKVDERQWLGWEGFVANSAALSDVAPIGSRFRAIDTDHDWLRKLVSGTPTWVDLNAPVWQAIGLPSSVVPSGQAPQVARINGLTVLRGGYAKADSSTFVAGGGTGGSYSLGTLPAGYRPAQSMSFTVDYAYTTARAQHVRVTITSGGVMTATIHVPDVTGSPNGVSAFRIDGITFAAEN